MWLSSCLTSVITQWSGQRQAACCLWCLGLAWLQTWFVTQLTYLLCKAGAQPAAIWLIQSSRIIGCDRSFQLRPFLQMLNVAVAVTLDGNRCGAPTNHVYTMMIKSTWHLFLFWSVTLTPFLHFYVMILTCVNQYKVIGPVALLTAWGQLVNKDTKALSSYAAMLSGCQLLLLDVI